MADPRHTTADLQEIARRCLGRELGPEEAEATRPRLLLIPRNLEVLGRWEAELHDVAPWAPPHDG